MADDLPESSTPPPPPFRLGELEILPASHEIRGPGGVERIRPLVMRVLLRLAAEPGTVVRRETLLEDVWPRRMVNDEVLSRAVAELRTALGDDARGARYIETIPKAGYRLVAAVAPLEAAQAPPPGADPPPMPGEKRHHAATGLALLAVVALVAVAAWWRVAEPPARGLEGRLAAASPITGDPGLELSPRFSPDGARIAFAALAVAGREGKLVVQRLDGRERRAYGDPGWLHNAPAFTPDGARLVAWRGNGETCGLVEVALDTGASRELVDCRLRPRSRFDLAPDGRHVAFTGDTRAQFPGGLWLAPLDGGEPKPLTTPEPGMADDAFPRFSPDGRRLAFFRGGLSHRRLWILPLDAPQDAKPVSPLEGLVYGAAWMGPEGPLLVAADWLGFRALVVVDLATGEATLAGARGAQFPDISRGGDVAWEHATYASNLWLVPAEGPGEPRALWPSTRYSSQPEFSPDGRALAFSSNREGTDAIYAGALDGEPRRIAGDEAHRYLRPHWSADGRTVHAVRVSRRPDGSAIQEAVAIPAAGGEPRVVSALGTAVGDVRETRDGRFLLWGELAGHALRLMRAPADRPQASERLPVPLAAHYHANATHLVIAQPQVARLVACRLADFACAPTELDVAEPDLFHWSLADRSTWRRVRDGPGAFVERREFPSGASPRRVEVAPSGAGTSIAVAPDESRLVVAREEGPSVDLMLARR